MDLRQKAATHGILAAPKKSAARSSPTLDLTLLLLVRALDSVVQGWIRRQAKSSNDKHAQRIKWLDAQLDGLLFWLCSTRIMWSYFYRPERLPRSYVRWINALARIDPRLQLVLRAVKERKWIYGRPASPPESKLMTSLATSMGLPADWGNPQLLPGHSGHAADVAWAQLGVQNRPGVGGLPCELVHGSQYGSSCTVNVAGRAAHSFLQALAIYAPVHVLPVLLAPSRRARLLANPGQVLTRTALNATRSAAFLSAFIGLIWGAICAGRSAVVPRIPGLRERLGHQFLDGPYGAVLAGCAVCGASIFIETPGRRGEIALYVMPRAVRSLLPGSWIARDNRPARLAERTVAVISLAWLAMAATHDPGSLRGLSRWALTFVYRGKAPNGSVTPKRSISEVDQPAAAAHDPTLPN
ncbi:hypothetical protein AURDEDRAFT_62058 [Auricularia subglabra TFB-10046 SS5]|nr:hypothetical protein AURDEDRAFT_62058 [Auricularia subglabra TFB-10046 SS5]